MTFHDEMVAKGWTLEHMGGGMKQYVQVVDEDARAEMRLTDGDFGWPMAMDEPCVLIFEEDNGSRGGYVRHFPSVAAMFEWEATAEYLLPENGDGPEANGWRYVPIML